MAAVPATILTGFLGSGKTTLLRALLRHPGMARTAVVINEFGEIGLDHDLVEASDEQIVQLSGGCLCCAVRSDLALTLGDLLARRAKGLLPPFERIVIETSGLAEPAPILQALMTDPALAEGLRIDGVVTLVDALAGAATLDRHPEAVRQVAVADRILVSKPDLAPDGPARLAPRLAALNPGAPVLAAARGAVDPDLLFAARDAAALLPPEGHAHAHDAAIAAVSLVRERPVAAVALTLFLQALAENCGDALLRLKGIVHVVESPDRPAVVHGVQHVFHPPVWLPRWPSADRRTRIVLIGRAIPPEWPGLLLDLIERDVAASAARPTS